MRIIAGIYRGRKIDMVDSNLTRESADKVRGAVFNSLFNKVINADVLNMFAGSGSYGIEALSRGAKHTTFVDIQQLAVKTCLANLEKLNVPKNMYDVVKSDYKLFAKMQHEKKVLYDIILLDPPYDINEYEYIVDVSEKLLKEDGLIVLETNKTTAVNNIGENLEIIKIATYGLQKITYIRKKSKITCV